jgi:hypothetical protein
MSSKASRHHGISLNRLLSHLFVLCLVGIYEVDTMAGATTEPAFYAVQKNARNLSVVTPLGPYSAESFTTLTGIINTSATPVKLTGACTSHEQGTDAVLQRTSASIQRSKGSRWCYVLFEGDDDTEKGVLHFQQKIALVAPGEKDTQGISSYFNKDGRFTSVNGEVAVVVTVPPKNKVLPSFYFNKNGTLKT